ncbi:MAG TPA: hypothetical protein VHN20_12230 [Beijerinckiaceae bacterium]|nr:hypothetical protein [Beijerinckiaceae bacterium]
MLSKHEEERALSALLAQIETAPIATTALVERVLAQACPRLNSGRTRNVRIGPMIDAQAWVDLGLWLIGWELPDWGVHSLSCDESRWNCTIGRRGLVINWADVAQFQHDSAALAVLGAFVQAQLNKLVGVAPSIVATFRPAGGGAGAAPKAEGGQHDRH